MDTKQLNIDLKDRVIYIAGPMKGKEDLNFPAFNEAYYQLREQGDEVINPVHLSRDLSTKLNVSLRDLTEREFALEDTQAIITRCTHMYMLEGWEYSKGAKAEHALAEWLGLTILYQSEGSREANAHFDKEWWFNFQADQFKKISELTRKKNDDYTGGADAGNPFANFDEADDFGVDPLVGLSVRMGDKMQRLKSYCNGGLSLDTDGDTVADIFRDFIGYSSIALGMLERKSTGTH